MLPLLPLFTSSSTMSTDIVILEDDPSWALGDVLLVSSDHVKLYASSHILAYARYVSDIQKIAYHSPVFQEMLSLPNPHGPNTQERTLRLTDPDFEDAQTIRTALSLFTYHRLDFKLVEDEGKDNHDDQDDEDDEDDEDDDDEDHDQHDGDYTDSEGEGNAENDWSGDLTCSTYDSSYTEIDVDDSSPAIPWKLRLLKLISFFDKYDSDRGFSLLKAAGAEAYYQKKFRHAVDAFVFAAITGNIDLCTAVVGVEDFSRWGAPKSKDTNLAQRPGQLLNINFFPYQYQLALPPQFQFALKRACWTDMPGTPSFAKAFARILKAALAAKGESSKLMGSALTVGSHYEPVSNNLPTLRREPRP